MRRLLLALLLLAALPGIASAGTVVGGREADEAEYPYAVYFAPGIFACGGTLIDERWVLTAGHCADSLTLFEDLPAVPWPGLAMTAYVGSNRAAGGEPVGARRAIIHPDYDKTNSQYDVALVELSEAVALPTAKIAGPGEEPLWGPGVTSTIIGWGDTEEGAGEGSNELREAEVPIVPDADCAKAYAGRGFIDYAADLHLCAGLLGTGGVDTCQGDSGGPLLVRAADGAFRVAGVTSTGEGCARAEHPGVYTEVAGATIRAFVAEHVPAAIAPPTRAGVRNGGGGGGEPAPQPQAPQPQPQPQPSGTGSPQSDPDRTAKTKRKPRACRKAKKAKKGSAKRKRLAKKCRKARKRQRRAAA